MKKEYKYEHLKTPKGLKEVSHFFINDKGMEEKIEFYIFEVEADYAELPNGWNVEKGNIVTGNAFSTDNYRYVHWGTSNDGFWQWFDRVMLHKRDIYEITFSHV